MENDSPDFTLDETNRSRIIALLTLGSSRRRAAQFVGCAPSTITRAIQRDPDFAARVATAEQSNESLALSNLRAASRRNWRASAWLLERTNPDDFASRRPNVITGSQLAETLAQLSELLFRELSNTSWRRVLDILNHLIQSMRSDNRDCLSCQSCPSKNTLAESPPAAQSPIDEPSVQHPSSGRCELATNPKSSNYQLQRT